MSLTRNRELSQFGSFVYIDNNTQRIGIATESVPNVGIGTADPSVKLEVVGDTNIKGNLSVSNGGIDSPSYTINGLPLVDVTILQWNYASNNQDIYRIDGSLGVGTSSISERVTVIGNVSAGQFISTVTSGVAPFVVLSDTEVTNLNASFLRGKVPPSGDIVGDADEQTLTNKTLISPEIQNPDITSPGITGGLTILGSISGASLLQASSNANGVLTLPAETTTLVGRGTTDTFTNKTISANNNTISGLTNSNLSGNAGITTANLAQSTISGVPLGGSLFNLSFGSFLNAPGSYNGSTARTVSVAATTTNTANTIVARDSSGDFSAGTVNASIVNLTNSIRVSNTTVLNGNRNLINLVNGSFSGIVTATDFNSSSDINLKDNVETIKNATETIECLRGVSFEWKETGKKSYGVIAQELEEVLPELVNGDETKTVNYNGLIGVLIQAIKEQQEQINKLQCELDAIRDAR